MPQPPSGCPFAADPHREMTGMIYGFCVSQIIRTASNCHWPITWPQVH